MLESKAQHRSASPIPGPTFVVLGATAVITGLQFRFPVLLTALCRTPGEIANHQYWRLLTSLFVHNEGWPQIVFNFVAIAVVGVICERIYGNRSWLILYFTGGIIGQIAGIYWKPLGAGASVGGAGLLGALATWMIKHPLMRAKSGGAVIILGACVLIYFRDLHGPPLLAGSLMGMFMPQQRLRSQVPEASG